MAKLKQPRKKKRHILNQKSHWIGEKPDIINYFGFIYLITNNLTGKMYIGRKQYYIAKQGSPRSRVANTQSKKWNRKHWRPSGWECYTGSSKDLNKDIKKLGKENFTFEILNQQVCKGDLHYAEIKEQVNRDVLVTTFDNGEPLYYNKSIASIKFRPPSYLTDEQRDKLKGDKNPVHKALANGNHYTLGTGHTEVSRKKLSKSVKEYYENMTPEQEEKWKEINRQKGEKKRGTSNHKFRPWAYKEPDGEWVEMYDKTIKDWYTENGYPKVKISSVYNKRSDAFYYRWEFKILGEEDAKNGGQEPKKSSNNNRPRVRKKRRRKTTGN